MGKPILSTAQLRPFARDGKAYKAFGSVIFADVGSVLVVPQEQIADLCNTVDGCPVPHEEVLAITSQLLDFSLEFPVTTHPSRAISRMSLIAGQGWQHRPLPLHGCGRRLGLTEPSAHKAWLFAHPTGVRYAITYDHLFPGK